ncbi:hypothetical protein RJ55_02454 [Drechmeria coniospora]|nr:hypothetical protein RJ55_02454 [Drechmeria coniospora]
MASTFAPAVPDTLDQQHLQQLHAAEARSRSRPASSCDGHPTAPVLDADADLLPSGIDSLSPSANQFETPAGSTTTVGPCQSSDFGDLDEYPFFAAHCTDLDGTAPSFLDNPLGWNQSLSLFDDDAPLERKHHVADDRQYPLTPTHTSTGHAASPRSAHHGAAGLRSTAPLLPDSISPQQLQNHFKPTPVVIESSSNLTPSRSNSNRTSEDSLAPAPVSTNPQSPRVTVSVWGKDDTGPVHALERTFDEVTGGIYAAGDLISSLHDPTFASSRRAPMDHWMSEPTVRRSGLDPTSRPEEEVTSINDVARGREAHERDRGVAMWLSENPNDGMAPREHSSEDLRAIEQAFAFHGNDDVPFGLATENKYVAGQTYYAEGSAAPLNDADRRIIAADRNWADAPVLHQITTSRPGLSQPQSSQDAIERFERLCRDNDSIISRSATWGTRRRSFTSVCDLDVEAVTSGSFLKKLSLSRGGGADKGTKSGGLLRDLRGLIRRPSASSLRKRSRSRSRSAKEAPSPKPVEDVRRDNLSPMARASSCGQKPTTPSINTALVNMAHNFASIGTVHSRSGSVSGPTPMLSPKSGLGRSLSVKNALRRPRSKSEVPKASEATTTTTTTTADSHPNLMGIWRKSGGPPVAALAKTSHVNADDDDDEDDDDDDLGEDNDVKANPNMIDDIAPNFAGFRQHIVALNPGLDGTHAFLVERIAHQQIVRYKHLLGAKVKHLGLGAHCPCGPLCLALGGAAKVADQRGDHHAGALDDVDDDGPGKGAINQESFPQDIPVPPTPYLPAEFECQLCYQRKRFQKPSDWTKHVHEDVQPFTCTWDKCRDAKIFKRKADWVRHENEGHRHLEWWTCDVDDCRHTCYRRDNFLQHLVREHKFLEPKVKTKAAMKQAGGMDPTWQKVEQCHRETATRSQEEACRFCGRSFPTWKKLTVHLAKHMEQISLPVLRLVAAKEKELAADTVISPVQEPFSRPTKALPNESSPPPRCAAPMQPQQPLLAGHVQMTYTSQGHLVYPVLPQGQYPTPPASFYPMQYGNIEQSLQQPGLSMEQMERSVGLGQPPLHGMTQASAASAGAFPHVGNQYLSLDNDAGLFPHLTVNALGLQNVGGSPMRDTQPTNDVGYDPMMNPVIGPSGLNRSPFSGHESLSTYSHSPLLNTSSGESNGQEQMWDEKRPADLA